MIVCLCLLIKEKCGCDLKMWCVHVRNAAPYWMTQQIVLKFNLRAEQSGLLPQRTNTKGSWARLSQVHLKIRWHSFKEQIKQNMLKRKFHYSTWNYFPAKSNSLFSRAWFTFPFDFPYNLFSIVLCKYHTLGRYSEGRRSQKGFLTCNATQGKMEKGNPWFHSRLSLGVGLS